MRGWIHWVWGRLLLLGKSSNLGASFFFIYKKGILRLFCNLHTGQLRTKQMKVLVALCKQKSMAVLREWPWDCPSSFQCFLIYFFPLEPESQLLCSAQVGTGKRSGQWMLLTLPPLNVAASGHSWLSLQVRPHQPSPCVAPINLQPKGKCPKRLDVVLGFLPTQAPARELERLLKRQKSRLRKCWGLQGRMKLRFLICEPIRWGGGLGNSMSL